MVKGLTATQRANLASAGWDSDRIAAKDASLRELAEEAIAINEAAGITRELLRRQRVAAALTVAHEAKSAASEPPVPRRRGKTSKGATLAPRQRTRRASPVPEYDLGVEGFG